MDDLIQIKRHYGEKMMHLCRELFPTLLETPGLLYSLLTKYFNPSRLLYNDIVNYDKEYDFKNFIFNMANQEKRENKKTDKTPKELFDELGYDFYECKTEEDIQSFIKYYAPREQLCTFHGGRLDRCYVFWVVKKNVDEIKRENFKEPQRQDEYGTSVMSIQFTRSTPNTVSIKNRYNHTVMNPDATFSNDLENIAEGLTESFERTYGLKINSSQDCFEIPGYVLANDGKYYKYNYEKNNIYYCPDNIIIDNFEVKKFDPSKYIVMDYFIIDLVNKKITQYDANFSGIAHDSFINDFNDIKRIEIKTDKETKEKIIIIDNDIIIKLDNKNRMSGYTNPHIKKTNPIFLADCTGIKEINLPNVEEISHNFLTYCASIKEINLPKVKKIGCNFIAGGGDFLERISLPNVEEIEHGFLQLASKLKFVDLPKVTRIGDGFLKDNSEITEINLPSVRTMGSYCFKNARSIEKINLPNVEEIGDWFLMFDAAKNIKEINFPKLRKVGECFLYGARNLEKLNLPNLETAGPRFLKFTNKLEVLYLPKLMELGDESLEKAAGLKVIDLPNVEKIGYKALEVINEVKEVFLPNVEKIDDYAFSYCEKLETIEMPRAKEVGYSFLFVNRNIKKFIAPVLEKKLKTLIYLDKDKLEICEVPDEIKEAINLDGNQTK